MNWKDGITTRAVLYDIAQLKGVDWVDPTDADQARGSRSVGEEIRREDRPRRHPAALHRPLEEARGARCHGPDRSRAITPTRFRGCTSGCRRSSATTSTSTGIRAPAGKGMRNPIHVAVLNWMGINIVECLDLEQAVATARRLNRYEFVITFAPLPVEGGTGSPVNPIVIF